MTELAAHIVTTAADRLLRTYMGRLECAVAELPDADLWWRPHERCTSVGNLLLHLNGNLRQWLLSGLGGAPDDRDRASEFAAHGATQGAAQKQALLAALRATVEAASAVVAAMDDAALVQAYEIQGFATTGYKAMQHTIEHFGWHTGQAVWIAKLRAGPAHGIQFYDEAAVNAARNTPR